MTTVVLSPTGVIGFPDGGGHWWVYLQYLRGLRDLGCDVWWLERLTPERAATNTRAALRRLEGFGLARKLLVYTAGQGTVARRWVAGSEGALERLAARADLLLNFDYNCPPDVVGRFARSALVDIDPGLLQQWIASGQVAPAPHDSWFTIGETVGTERASFTDAGIAWHRIRPLVHLASWPVRPTPSDAPYTTVTSWWGDEWVTDATGLYENNKRITFLEYADLPVASGCTLEIAGYFGGPPAGEVLPELTGGDADDIRRMRRGGWRLRRSSTVAATPWAYRRYVQSSRGEFSCAKPSCLVLQNAWISDRTLCYLASGRPAVVQDTGPSGYLPAGEGLLRFRSLAEAAAALHGVERAYRTHATAARGLAESLFDSRGVLPGVLDTALSAVAVPPPQPDRSS